MTDSSAAPRIGAPAPDFSLPSTAGRDVSLGEFRGTRSVLLAFFPLAFTSTCTSEMNAFTEDFERFTTAGAVILPISTDSVPTLKEYKSKYAMKVDLLSDFKRTVSRQYDVLIEEKYHPKRAYFLVDRAGVLRWAHTEAVLGDRRTDAELLERIAALG
ncbi:MAG TPA: redoxin domain-containing protein [Gemmatimonadales bacterium]|nr:redoxin domain-containing protein [Gemmatimonadales bacterium]